MASCRSCGADITVARTRGGEIIPLEKYTEATGDRRYRVVEATDPLVVEMVSPTSTADAYPDHRKDCPGHDDGLT
jgi:hypothetical protein